MTDSTKFTVADRTLDCHYAIRNIVGYAKNIERQGQEILYLNIGDPAPYGFPPPATIVNSLFEAIGKGNNGYTPSAGIATSRQAICDDARSRGIPSSPESVWITNGSSEAVDLLFSALLNPGDGVLLPSPGYPLYKAIISKLGGRAIFYTCRPENNWHPDPQEVRSLIDGRVKALLVINPNNPTGAVYPAELLAELLQIAAEHQLLTIADEVYHRLCFADAPAYRHLASLTPPGQPVVTLDSLSKSHLVPGWRIGWMNISYPEALLDVLGGVQRLADARLCSFGPAQFVVPEALTAEGLAHIPEFMRQMDERRQLLKNIAADSDLIDVIAPQGAFYVMLTARDAAGGDDEEFVKALVRETGVLVVHGSGFGYDAKAGSMRLVFLPSPTVLQQAMHKLIEFCQHWHPNPS